MEESVRRKERLKAMHSEAALVDVPNDVETSGVPGQLSNPMIETSSMQEEFLANSRFDFYTDPMAAFSANRKRGKVDGQGGQDYFTPPNTSGWRGGQHSSPLPECTKRKAHTVGQVLYPCIKELLMLGMGPEAKLTITTILPLEAHGDISALPPFIREPLDPGMEQEMQGRSQFGNNLIYGSVHRGSTGSFSGGGSRGNGYGNSPNIGRGGRQGPGFYRHNLSSDRTPGAERFYHESMLEDPWQHLEPILWRKQGNEMTNPCSSNSWLPKSNSVKKEKVPEPFNKSSSQPSLAAYLASSFNKAVKDSPSE
ncbi:hypothetical protein SLEP1_g42055 [Rubroshorea leprosula]|uniref:Uncharacterized protein n=1 Tax=Rubroshorea leprosula TaxID=152421 RepID=A0AAV5L8I7_9ROSI|nr:hypothetical protein SLEP1_g42055 [Rubroshorea leprosula]